MLLVLGALKAIIRRLDGSNVPLARVGDIATKYSED